MPKRKDCPSCGASFTYNRREPRLCPICRKEEHRTKARKRYEPKSTIVPCQCCGSLFQQDHGRQKYCSDECRHEAIRRAGYPQSPATKACNRCGSKFSPRGRQLTCDKCLPELKLEKKHGKQYCCIKHKMHYRTTSKNPQCPECKKEEREPKDRFNPAASTHRKMSAAMHRMRRASYLNFNDKKSKERMNKRGLCHDLSFEDFVSLKEGPCVYCGTEHRYERLDKETGMTWKYNTIDRIDPNKGYTKENCVPCCHKCNSAKSDFTLQEFKDHVRKMFDHMGLGQYPPQL